jgi:DEAD/DEAH box helicase domain-containing protein
MHDELLTRTRELIDECPCDTGCPSCVGPIGSTGPHTKKVAQELLRRMGATGSPAGEGAS